MRLGLQTGYWQYARSNACRGRRGGRGGAIGRAGGRNSRGALRRSSAMIRRTLSRFAPCAGLGGGGGDETAEQREGPANGEVPAEVLHGISSRGHRVRQHERAPSWRLGGAGARKMSTVLCWRDVWLRWGARAVPRGCLEDYPLLRVCARKLGGTLFPMECGSALLCRFCFSVFPGECGSGFPPPLVLFLFFLGSAAVLCSAALVSQVLPLLVTPPGKTEKQKRQSKALPHSKKGQKSN